MPPVNLVQASQAAIHATTIIICFKINASSVTSHANPVQTQITTVALNVQMATFYKLTTLASLAITVARHAQKPQILVLAATMANS